jgi:hypothetical protein
VIAAKCACTCNGDAQNGLSEDGRGKDGRACYFAVPAGASPSTALRQRL